MTARKGNAMTRLVVTMGVAAAAVAGFRALRCDPRAQNVLGRISAGSGGGRGTSVRMPADPPCVARGRPNLSGYAARATGGVGQPPRRTPAAGRDLATLKKNRDNAYKAFRDLQQRLGDLHPAARAAYDAYRQADRDLTAAQQGMLR